MTGRRLLYLAFFYPPSRASGVYRSVATAEAFSAAGWEVVVITTTPEFFADEIGSVDPTLNVNAEARTVEVVRIPFSFSRHRDVDVRKLGWLAGHLPGLHFRMAEAGILPGHGRDGRRPFPDKYRAWIDPVVNKAISLHGEQPFDLILATGNPYSSFQAARVISEEAGTPYAIDYRDPWTFDVGTGRPLHDSETDKAEADIISSASAIFHVNHAIADAYADRYPEAAARQHVAMNGFDASSIGAIRERHQGPITFGMLGTVTERWPLRALFEGWSVARGDLPDGSELVLAGHLGFFEHSESVVRSLLPGESEAFRYVGPIPKQDVAGFNASLDVVVVPVPGGPMVTSGKVFEALALGVPVVCIQSPGGGARRLLADHPFGYEADPTADSVAAAIRSAADAVNRVSAADREEVRRIMARYERRNAIRPIVEVADRITEHGAVVGNA